MANKGNGKVDLSNYEGEVMTYDGMPATILDRNMSGDRPILVKHQDQKGNWVSSQVRPNGELKRIGTPFIVPAPSTGFMNVRRRKDGRITGGTVYPTVEACLKRANENTVHKAVKVPL
jgi:hypothetical protein